MSYIDVTKILCNYIRSHNLQNPENKQEIQPDENLTTLLNYDSEKDGTLTYCSSQINSAAFIRLNIQIAGIFPLDIYQEEI